MGRWVRCLEASTLVHGHVHRDRTRFHRGYHAAGNQLGCLGPKNKHGADEQISLRHRILNVKRVGHQGLDLAEKYIVEKPEPVRLKIDDRHPRPKPDRHFCCIRPHNASP